MTFLFLFLVFMLGTAVGSFVGVVIFRTINEGVGTPFKGRSFCDHCRRQLNWFENIPLLSFLVLGGQCRTCKKKIPLSYPMVEAITGLLFVWWASLGFAFFRLTQAPLLYVQPIFWLLVGLLLVVIFFADFLYGIIPDFASLIIGILILAYRGFLLWHGALRVEDFVLSVIAGLVASGVFLLLYLGTKRKGLGFGDVKFALVMGLLLGVPKALVGFFLAFVIGGLVGLGLLVVRKKKLGQKIPFGPFLIVGLVLALMWGNEIWGWYLSLL